MAPPHRTSASRPHAPPRGHRKRLDWTKQMKEYLWVLHDEFPGARAERMRVFQVKFQAHAARCGVTDITTSMLSAQYGERNKTSGTNRDWQDICAPTRSQRQIEWREAIRSDINRLARSTSAAAALPVARTPRIPPSRDTDIQYETEDESSPSTRTRARRNNIPTPHLTPRRPQSHSEAHGEENIGQDVAPLTPQSVDDDIDMTINTTPERRSRQRRQPLADRPSGTVPRINFPGFMYARPDDDRRRIARMRSKPVSGARPLTARAKDGRLTHAPLMVTGEQLKKLNMAWQAPSAQEAHAWPGALLYRFLENVPGDVLNSSDRGFVSRFLSEYPQIWPGAPSYDMLSPHDLANHVQGNHFPSPFISFTNNLFWVLRRAFREYHKLGETGAGNMYVSVVATDRLDQSALFHLLPYHRKLKLKYPYYDAAEKYGTSHEWLVYGKVSPGSIIRRFSVADLLRQSFGSVRAKSLLSYEILIQPIPTMLAELRSDVGRKKLAHGIPFIAQLSNFVGITANSNPEQISALLTDVLRGWHFSYEKEDWDTLAARFSSELIKCCQRTSVEHAFRSGVYWASGPKTVPNPWHDTNNFRSLQRSTQHLGLRLPREDQRLQQANRSIGALADLQIQHERARTTGPRLPPSAGALQAGREGLPRSRPGNGSFPDGVQSDDEDEDDTRAMMMLRRQWRLDA